MKPLLLSLKVSAGALPVPTGAHRPVRAIQGAPGHTFPFQEGIPMEFPAKDDNT